MNKRKALLDGLYTLTLAAILWYPVSKIIKFEFPSQEPVEIKFKATVFDPYDPMRGKYVQLRVMPDLITTSDNQSRFNFRDNGHIVIEKGKNGFVKVLRLEKDMPVLKKGEFAVRVNRIYYQNKYRKQAAGYNFSWPFARFYLNELKAPELENELRNSGKDIVLKVKFFRSGGFAVSGIEK